MELQDGLGVLLQSHCFGHLEHVTKCKNKVRDTQVVSFVDHECFHGILVVVSQSGHFFLHVVEEGDDSEEGFRVNEQDVLVNKCVVGLIRQREEPSIHAYEAFDQRRYLFLLDEARHRLKGSSSSKRMAYQVYLL